MTLTFRKLRGKYPALFASFLVFAFSSIAFSQNNRDYGDGPLKWDEDFKQDPIPSNSPYDAAVTCDIALVTPTEQAPSSGGDRGVPTNDCIECKDCKPREQGKKQFRIKKSKKCRVKVKAYIKRDQSWSKPDKQTDALLAHEQGHFDLWEATARAAEKRINEEWHCIEAVNCKLDGKNAFRNYIDTIINEERQKGIDINEKYDEETDHGRKEEKQKEWEEKIKKLLAIKGGPTWDQINGTGSKSAGGHKTRLLSLRNLPTTQVTFSQAILQNIPWATGPVILEFPAMVFEDHGNQHSRLWADRAPAVIEIYDLDFNPIGFANFSAFFGNETDTEFTTFLSGPTAYDTDDAGKSAVPDQTVPPEEEEEDILISTQLTIVLEAPLGQTLADLGPGGSFDCKYEIGLAPGDPHPGDINYDGFVDDLDVAPMERAILGEEVLIYPYTGDLNGDRVINDEDLRILLGLLQGTSP